MKVVFKVEGVAEVAANARNYGLELTGPIVRIALRDAMKVGEKAIKAATYSTVARRTGLLRTGMTARKVKKIKLGQPAYGVYALPYGGNSKGGKKKSPFYWRFIEFGTKKMAARPYIGRAFASVATEMTRVFRASMARGVEKAKAAKKTSNTRR